MSDLALAFQSFVLLQPKFSLQWGILIESSPSMNVSAAPLVERFLCLCSYDRRLREAIAELRIDTHPDGMIALISATPLQSPWLSHFMPEIVGFLCQLGHFKAIVIQTDNYCLPFEMSDLLAKFPPRG